MDLELLRRSERDSERIKMTVSRARYSCCGRGWTRRDYEASYRGVVRAFDEERGQFLLFARGLGKLTYVVHVCVADILEASEML